MKKIIFFFFLVCSIPGAGAQGSCTDGFTLPFLDSFENTDKCWTVHNLSNDATNQVWHRTQESLYYWEGAHQIYYPAAHTGTYAYICKGGDYPKSLLISPKIKIPAGKISRLSFWSLTDLNKGNMYIRVYTDTTDIDKNYAMAWGPQDYHTAFPPTWENIVLNLTAFAGKDVYIGFLCDNGWMGLTWIIDDVEVYSLYEHDAGVISINAPQSGTDLGQENVNVTLKNFGTQSITTLPVGIELNGQYITTKTFSGNIPSGGEAVFNLQTSIDLSSVKTHQLKVYTDLTGEQNRSNDTLTVAIHNYGHSEITQFPYREGFEDNETLAFWKQEVIKFDENKVYWTFMKGTPGLIDEYQIKTAHSGNRNATFHNLNLSLYESIKNQKTKLITPKINLGSLQAPLLKFWHTQSGASREGSGLDTLKVYYKNSAAGEWKLLYNEKRKLQNWTQTILILPEKSDDYYVAFEGSTGIGYGVALDDVTIEDADNIDVKLLEITAPVTGNDLQEEAVTIRLQNFGKQELINIPVCLKVDGAVISNEEIPGPIASFEETSFTFNKRVNLSAEKTYNIEVYAKMPGDNQSYNDTVRATVVNYVNKAVMGTNRNVTSCGIKFLDDGIDDNYKKSMNETQIITLYPADAGHLVKVDFTSFELAPFTMMGQTPLDGDSLIVYEGDVIDPKNRIAVLLDRLELPYSIVSHAGNGALTFVFHKVSAASATGWEADVTCVTPNTKDAGIWKILSPAKGGNAADKVTVQIKNYGSETIRDFDVAYQLTDVNTITVTGHYEGSIAPGGIEEFTFTQPADLSAYSENYRLTVYTLLNGDADATNDSITANYFYRENVELSGFCLWQAGFGNRFVPVSFGSNSSSIVNAINSDYQVNTTGVMVAGAYGDGNLYAFTANVTSKGPMNFVKLTSDFETVTTASISSEPLSPGGNPFLPADITYDFTTNTLYAIWVETIPAVGKITTYLVEVDKNTGKAINGMELQYMLACIAADSNGDLYGISDNGYFCYVDKNTGAVNPISHTGAWAIRDWQSMTFDHRTGRLFWAINSGSIGNLYEIRVPDGRVDDLGPIGKGAEISALFTPYQATGVKDIHTENSISVYPNPVKDKLTIRNEQSTIQEVKIVDVSGVTVYHSTFLSDNSIDVSSWPSGVYLVKIVCDGKSYIHKIIK